MKNNNKNIHRAVHLVVVCFTSVIYASIKTSEFRVLRASKGKLRETYHNPMELTGAIIWENLEDLRLILMSKLWSQRKG